jgi:hypothetical protein
VIAVRREDDVPAAVGEHAHGGAERPRREHQVVRAFITSRAPSRDDTTTMGTSPILSSMTDPWRLARSRMARCGS